MFFLSLKHDRQLADVFIYINQYQNSFLGMRVEKREIKWPFVD